MPYTPCDCSECKEHGGANPKIIKFRVAVLIAQFLYAVWALNKEGKRKALGVFLAAVFTFMTVLRYLVCARCEAYGENCYSLNMGKMTSWYMKKQEPRIFSVPVVLAEGAAIATIAFTPAIALRHDTCKFLVYSALNGITLGTQGLHSCMHCAKEARPDWGWRYKCPSARMLRLIFGINAKGPLEG